MKQMDHSVHKKVKAHIFIDALRISKTRLLKSVKI